ncbi:MAG: endonuclease/exonuclease/phosphatase family protein [Bacteroidetes bacterium]|nr:endonuclease/exonuclease/phosphatase family protein [Bacteroidota bacterium]
MRNIFFFLFFFLSFYVDAQINVMTYNIRNSHAADGVNKWNKRKQSLANVVLKMSPDILSTQEVLENQRKDLIKMLPAYDVFGVGRNNGKHAGEHSAIFYKREKYEIITGGNFWLSETPNLPGSKSWDAAITRICSWVKLKDKQTYDEIYVFNTHFDHRGNIARTKSASLLRYMIDSIADDKPVIVAGDFNFKPDSEGYTEMISENHKINFSDAYSANAPDYTDCGFEVSSKKCSRIDYIFFSKHFIKDSYTLHTDNNGTYYPSDHLTISVALRIKRLKI